MEFEFADTSNKIFNLMIFSKQWKNTAAGTFISIFLVDLNLGLITS